VPQIPFFALLQALLSDESIDSYNYWNLHAATFRLTDFGQSVLFNRLAAAPNTLIDAAPPLMPLHSQQQPASSQQQDAAAVQPPVKHVLQLDEPGHSVQLVTAPYTLDGQVTLTDPWLRPPEVL
jgi:hypothetical protein